MKNTILKSACLLIILAFLSTDGYAQKVKGNGKLVNKSREVGRFDQLGVGGSFDVILVKGNEGKLELSVEENLEPYLITQVKDGKLKIQWKKGHNIRTTKKTLVTVHFNTLNKIGLSGAGDISSSDVVASDDLSVAIAGSGDINLTVNTGYVKAAISGSGDIGLKGETKELEGAIAGSGDIKAYDLQSEKAELKISGSGGMNISVEKELIARISGSGDIKYKGNPRIEDVKVSGSGNVSTF